jgi:hypothetical protein
VGIGLLGNPDLLKVARHDKGQDTYIVRFRYIPLLPRDSPCHEQIGDPTPADGILDRLEHHRIEMRGDSNAQASWEAERIALASREKRTGLVKNNFGIRRDPGHC